MANQPNNQKPGAKKKKKVGEPGGDDIFQAPEITRDPSSKQVRLGAKLLLRITATGKPLPSYQWFHNGIKVIGATSERFMINKTRRNHAGAYTCEVKNFVGKVMSRAAMMSFFTERLPDIEVTPKTANVQAGKPFRFEISSPTADKLESFTFKWVFNGKRINGATDTKLEFTEVKKKYEGEYKVILIAGSEIKSSNVVTLKVLEKDAAPAVEPPPAAEPERAPEPVEDLFFSPEESEEAEPALAEAEPAPTEDDSFFVPDECEMPLAEPVAEAPAFAASYESPEKTRLVQRKAVLERFMDVFRKPDQPKKAA